MARDLSLEALRLHLYALNRVHRFSREKAPGRWPAVQTYMRGVARQLPRVRRWAVPCRREQLLRILAAMPRTGLPYLRDRMIALLMYFGALTTSQILALTVEQLRFKVDHLVLSGVGRRGKIIGRGSSLCAVEATYAWLTASGIRSGPLVRGIGGGQLGSSRDFVSDLGAGKFSQPALWALIRTWYARAGLPVKGATVLSFRAGFAVDAYEAGVRTTEIADHLDFSSTRHVLTFLRRLGVPLRPHDDAPHRRVRRAAVAMGYRPRG